MSTIVRLDTMIAEWNDEKLQWESQDEEFINMLNYEYETKAPWPPTDPFPSGTAVELAQKLFSEIVVVKSDKIPKFDENVVY